MALIKCPECQKDVSDKAEVCIHCGFPIQKLQEQDETMYIIKYICEKQTRNSITDRTSTQSAIKNILNIPINEACDILFNPPRILARHIYKDEAEWVKSYFDKRGYVIQIIEQAKAENQAHNEYVSNFIKKVEAPVSCPRCGSTQISTTQRGYSLLTGFLGSNKTVNRCSKCGHSWNP